MRNNQYAAAAAVEAPAPAVEAAAAAPAVEASAAAVEAPGAAVEAAAAAVEAAAAAVEAAAVGGGGGGGWRWRWRRLMPVAPPTGRTATVKASIACRYQCHAEYCCANGAIGASNNPSG